MSQCQKPKVYSAAALANPTMLDPNYTTLSKFIFAEENKFWQATGELSELLNCLQIIAKTISAMLRRVGLTHLFGITDQENKQPKKLQSVANEIFLSILTPSHAVGIMISKESKTVIEVPKNQKGKYILAYHPLDGASNLDCSITIGSSFAIMIKDTDDLPTVEDAVNPKNKMVGAGYMVYGSATNFVFSTGHGVNGFILDPQIGEFLLTERDMKIPQKGTTLSINEKYASSWENAVKEYVREKKFPDKGKPYSSRYVGSMVADVHRTLKQGGIFMYPATKERPMGKLRVMYECKPMAYIVTEAGGLATSGSRPILEINPTNIHQTTPIFLGSKEDVEEMESYWAKHGNKVF